MESVIRKIDVRSPTEFKEVKAETKRDEGARRSRSVELIILAILAALSLAVGELMGSIFGS